MLIRTNTENIAEVIITDLLVIGFLTSVLGSFVLLIIFLRCGLPISDNGPLQTKQVLVGQIICILFYSIIFARKF